MGIGSSRGEGRSIKAAETAINSPLLECGCDGGGARGVLLSIAGGSDLGLFEINGPRPLVQEAAHIDANIIFGTVIDDSLGDEVRVTVIAAASTAALPVKRPLEVQSAIGRGNIGAGRAGGGRPVRAPRRGCSGGARRAGAAPPVAPREPSVRPPDPAFRRSDPRGRVPCRSVTRRRGRRRRRAFLHAPLSGAAVTGVRVRRVVTSRSGGVSAAPYDSFNLGDHVGDDPAAVEANRRRLAEGIGLPFERLVWMEQIHSRNVTVVDGPVDGPVPATDALVTKVPGLALVTLSADCVPILLSDDEAGVIAAVHAGRIGARIGIVPKVLGAMIEQGARPERIGAFLGPAASGRQYEVPAAMQADVEKFLPGSATRTTKGTPGLDLRAGLRRQLLAAGVSGVAEDPRCTIEDPTLFSHRRGAPTGRLAAVIWMDPSGSE